MNYHSENDCPRAPYSKGLKNILMISTDILLNTMPFITIIAGNIGDCPRKRESPGKAKDDTMNNSSVNSNIVLPQVEHLE